MFKFYIRTFIYLFCFILTLIGLSAFDYNRFIKSNKIVKAWILYFILAFSLAYLFGSFLISVIYYLNQKKNAILWVKM